MSCCCISTYDLCSVGVCETLQTGIIAPVNGTYKLALNWLDTELLIEADGVTGEQLLFPTDKLNENFTYEGKILGTDGLPMQFVFDGDETIYDCVRLQTKLRWKVSSIA